MTRTHFTAATYNLGDGPDAKKREDILALFDQEGVDFLALQEAGDRSKVIDSIAVGNPRIARWLGDGSPGASSVPIMWRQDLWEVVKRKTVHLSSRFFAPEGVGPSWVKPKVVNLVWLRNKVTGEIVVFGSTHMPASLWARLRAVLGGGIVRKLRRTVDGIDNRVVVIGADWNAKVGARILRPLGRLISAQKRQGIKPTHGKRAIDDLRSRGVYWLASRTRKGSSDHLAFIAEGRS